MYLINMNQPIWGLLQNALPFVSLYFLFRWTSLFFENEKLRNINTTVGYLSIGWALLTLFGLTNKVDIEVSFVLIAFLVLQTLLSLLEVIRYRSKELACVSLSVFILVSGNLVHLLNSYGISLVSSYKITYLSPEISLLLCLLLLTFFFSILEVDLVKRKELKKGKGYKKNLLLQLSRELRTPMVGLMGVAEAESDYNELYMLKLLIDELDNVDEKNWEGDL